jgi:hypothetical protein
MEAKQVRDLIEAYASVYADTNIEGLNEEPSLGATKSAMAAQRSAQNAAGMRGPELTHGAKPGESPKPAGSATSGSSVTQPRSREFSHGTRKLKDVVKGGLTMSYELEGDQIDEIKTSDLFDSLLEYLVAEGYADTNKAALAIMANMGESWREDIVEQIKNDPQYDQMKKIVNNQGTAKPTKPGPGRDPITGQKLPPA